MESSRENLVKTLLRNPSSIKTKSQAKQLHAQIVKTRGSRSVSLATIILGIYSDLNLLKESLEVFNNFRYVPTKAWKSVVRCYSCHGYFRDSLACFVEMRGWGKLPGSDVFPSVVRACTHLKELRVGESVHGCVIRFGMESDLYTGNALMNMYAKLQVSSHDYHVFDEIPQSDRVYSRRSSLAQDSDIGILRNELIRSEKSHFEPLSGRRVKNAKGLDSVSKIFQMMPDKDVVSWNTVIGGNVQSGLYEEALERLREMSNAYLKPDCFTLSSVLPVFARHVDVLKGKEIHGYAIRHGFDKDEFIGSSLIDMYATCTRVEDSYRVFNLLSEKDDVSWNSIIAGCVQNGTFDEGLGLFRQMLAANVKPVEVSFSAILPACAHLTTLHLGKQLHAYIIRVGFAQNMYIASSLVDMYAKCGKIMTARWIFDKMEIHDSVSWTAIIMGYALNGHAREATILFENMQHDKIKPNAVAYLAILTACSHAGLVDEGWNYFTSMSRYGVSPDLEHYTSIADLLGRAGRLMEAYKFINDMPIKPTGSIWATLLSACRVHKNVELAEKVAKEMTTADPGNMGPYLLLSNMYSAAGRWNDASKLRTNMKKKGMRKPPACSWIEVRNQVHAFVSGDISHPCYDQIHVALRDLYERLKQEGYVPQISEALHDVDEEQKSDLLYTHSERLAIAFGIISTPAGTTIRIIKNLRELSPILAKIHSSSKLLARYLVKLQELPSVLIVPYSCSSFRLRFSNSHSRLVLLSFIQSLTMDHVVGGTYKLGRKVGKGYFAELYLGINVQTEEEVAVKLESTKTEHPQLHYESKLYRLLQGGTGIPNVRWFGVEGEYNAMVIDLLGPSLEDLFNYCNRRFTLKTALMLADQLINRIEYMHSRGFLHRDIKPETFLMGTGRKANQVYIIDYALAKKYRDHETYEHIPFRENKRPTGTARYSSVSTHLGVEQSRRDDLECLGYVLMYFLRGSLPWQGLKADGKKQKYAKITEKKMLTPIEVLCESYPSEFISYFYYCRSLQFEDKPDYSYLKRLFRHLFISEGFQFDYLFDWTILKYPQQIARSPEKIPDQKKEKKKVKFAEDMVEPSGNSEEYRKLHRSNRVKNALKRYEIEQKCP
ncbi:hypothetical protein KY290_038506 [Solanum tuberosum]|uniref:Protein kinase domain-containing protein n=2 Tax=Solanum tuberosum TaxID=4113 RepID=A0ABQ7U0B8_SOLTU|nr:hypothetical protein KY284_037049 [Solanum tuberosum]KAH0638141.1 hypothetical protein KY289_038056 [Solanum tuberosum]KAH0739801.1 hypothetical protein KY290_038506 [Solanum tuberosum]